MSAIVFGGRQKEPMRGGIRGRIAPGQLTPTDLLKLLDTLHDFWFTERHGNAGQARIIRGIINNVYSQILGFPVANLDPAGEHDDVTVGFKNLSTIGGRARIAGKLSDFENKVREFLAEKYPMEVRAAGRMSLTYDEVLADMNTDGHPILTALRAKKDSQGTIDLNNGARPIKSLSAAERSSIAEFILRYLFAGASEATENPTINMPRGITYDMSPGRVDDVFTNIDQVYNALYPTNFADSAGTSLQSARNRYVWPDTARLRPPSRLPFAWAPAPALGMQPDYVAESNIYTEGEVEFRIVDRGYSHKNPYGFNVRLLIAAVPGCWENKPLDFPFSPAQTTGPSVTYLCNIMEEMERAKSDSTAAERLVSTGGTNSKVLSLQPLVNWVYSLPFGRCRTAAANLVQRIALDWKREGDYGQMRAPTTNDLNCSGDILAAEASKVNQKRGTFWQHSDHIVVTRYPAPGGVDDGLGPARDFRYWAEGSLERLQTISDVLSPPRSGFNYMLGQFNSIAANGILSDRGDEPHKSNLLTAITGAKAGGHNTVEAYLEGAITFRPIYSEVLSSALIRILASQRANRALRVNTEVGAQNIPTPADVRTIRTLSETTPEAIQPQLNAPGSQLAALRTQLEMGLASLPTFLNLTFSRGPPPAPGTLGPIKRDSMLLKSTASAEQAYVASKATNLMFDFSAADVAPVTAAYRKLANILFFGRYNPDRETPAQASVRYEAFADLREKLDAFISYAGDDVVAPAFEMAPLLAGITLPQRGLTQPPRPRQDPVSQTIVNPTWKNWTEWFMSCYYIQELTGAEMRTFVVSLPEVMMCFTNLTPPASDLRAEIPPRAPAGGGGHVQTGGAAVAQSYELGERFRRICSRAVRDVNSVITTVALNAPAQAAPPAIKVLKAASDMHAALQETLEEIAIQWDADVDDISTNCQEEYREPYESSIVTELIQCILSCRSSQSVVGPPTLADPRFVLLREPRNQPLAQEVIGILTATATASVLVDLDMYLLIFLSMLEDVLTDNDGGSTYFAGFSRTPQGGRVFGDPPRLFGTDEWNALLVPIQTALRTFVNRDGLTGLPIIAEAVRGPVKSGTMGSLAPAPAASMEEDAQPPARLPRRPGMFQGPYGKGRKTHRRRRLPKLI